MLNKASAVVGEFTRPEVETLLPYASILHLNRYQKLWRPLAEPMSTFYVVVSGNIRLTGLGVTAHVGPEEGLAGAAWMRRICISTRRRRPSRPFWSRSARSRQVRSRPGDGRHVRAATGDGGLHLHHAAPSSYIPVLSGQRVAVIDAWRS